MAEQTYTEEEAVREIVLAVMTSEISAYATTLYRNRNETHEISFNSLTGMWELSQHRDMEIVASSPHLTDVAAKAVEEELWIEA